MADSIPPHIGDKNDALASRLELLSKSRKELRSIQRYTTVGVVLLLAGLMFTIYSQVTHLDAHAIIGEVSQSQSIQDVALNSLADVASNTYPILRDELNAQFLHDDTFLVALATELESFIEIAKRDIQYQLAPLYFEFVENQEQHLYQAFPQFRNNPHVQKIVDNMLASFDGRLVDDIILEPFNDHIESLVGIYTLLSENKEQKRIPHLERLVFGVTLEILGRKIQESIKEEA